MAPGASTAPQSAAPSRSDAQGHQDFIVRGRGLLFLVAPLTVGFVVDGEHGLAADLRLSVVAGATLGARLHLFHRGRTRGALLHLENLDVTRLTLLPLCLVLLVAEGDRSGTLLSLVEREVRRHFDL